MSRLVIKQIIRSAQILNQPSLLKVRRALPMTTRCDSEAEMETTTKYIVNTQKCYQPVGPYSQAVRAGDTLYISGVLGLDTKGKLVGNSAAEQAVKALENMESVLRAGGSTTNAVLKTTVLLANMDDFKAVNEVYENHFKGDYPARASFQVAKLPANAAVEIEVIALCGNVVVEHLSV